MLKSSNSISKACSLTSPLSRYFILFLTFNQVGGLCTLDFMNCMAKLVEKDRLLKKSILLLKAWFTYEASFLGSYAACMATYALYVLVLFIFNNFSD